MSTNNVIAVPIGETLDRSKKDKLFALFKLVEAAYDEQAIRTEQGESGSILKIEVDSMASKRLRDSFSLAVSSNP